MPASPSPSGFSKSEPRSESEDDLVEWSVRIKSLIPDQTKSDEGHPEVKKSNSERRKVVQWDPAVGKFSGRALSEKCYRKRRSGSVSVITSSSANIKTYSRDEKLSDNTKPYPAYPYPRHGSLPHAFRNGNHRHHLGELLVLACLSPSPQGDLRIENQYKMNFDFNVSDENPASVLALLSHVIYIENRNDNQEDVNNRIFSEKRVELGIGIGRAACKHDAISIKDVRVLSEG